MRIKSISDLPSLLPFWFTDQKEIIVLDARRWCELTGAAWTSANWNLMALLRELPEFRSVYYYRLAQGNSAGRMAGRIVRVFFRFHPQVALYIGAPEGIGPGLFIQHGFSTVIAARRIGANAFINQQVTIGYRNDAIGHPVLGDNVQVSAGAKVLGGITLGDNVVVGANAVVVKDVPPNCVVVGVPARIIKRDGVRV